MLCDALFCISNKINNLSGIGIILFDFFVLGLSIITVFLPLTFDVYDVFLICNNLFSKSTSSHVRASNSPNLIPV